MATTFQKNYDRVKKLRGSSSTSTSKTSQEKMQQQISNYKTRLDAAGQEKDTRNPLEKMLGLPEDQNVLFDVLEIMNRPQQALFTGINEAIQGGDFLEGAKSGLTGEEKTSGGDIMRSLGVSDDSVLNLFGKDVSLADILGFGLDIKGDPMNWALFTKTGKLAKGASEAANLADTAGDVAYKASASELLGSGLKNVTKKAAGKVDDWIERGLKGLDESNLNKIRQAADAAGQSIDGIKLASKLDDYQAIKKSVRNFFDYSKALPDNLISKIQGKDNRIRFAEDYAGKFIKNRQEETEAFLNKAIDSGKVVLSDDNTYEQAFKNLSADIQDLIEYNQPRTKTATELLKGAVNYGNDTIKGSAETIAQLNTYLDDVADITKSLSKDGTELTLSLTDKNKTAIRNLLKNEDNLKALDNMNIDRILGYTDDQVQRLEGLKTLYNSDKDFKDLIDNSKNAYSELARVFREATDGQISFQDIADRPWYVRRAVNKDLVGNTYESTAETVGNKQVFSGRKYDSALEANNAIQQEVQDKIGNLEKTKTSLTNQLYDNKKQSLESSINELKGDTGKIAQESKKLELKIDKKDLQATKLEGQIKNLNSQIDTASSQLNKKFVDRLSDVADESVYNKVSSNITSLTDEKTKLQDTLKQLNKKGITDAEKRELTNQVNATTKNIEKLTKQIDIDTAKYSKAVTTEELKQASEISKEIDDVVALKSKLANKQQSYERVVAQKQELQQGYEKYLKNADKKMKKLESELSSLDKANDPILRKQIADVQQQIDYFKEQGMQEYVLSDYFAGIGDFVKNVSAQSRAYNKLNNVLLSSSLTDEGLVKYIDPGTNVNQVQAGFRKISKQDADKLVSKMEAMKGVMPGSEDAIAIFKSQVENSNGIIMDKAAYDLIKSGFSDVNEEALHPIARMLNGFNNFFKKSSTFSPGFHLRNISGNTTNMYLSGVPLKDLPGLYSTSKRILNKDYMGELFDKAAKGALEGAEKADFDLLEQFVSSGFMGKGKSILELGDNVTEAGLSLKGLTKNKFMELFDNITDMSANANEYVDRLNRLSLFKYAQEHPEYLVKNGFQNARDAVAGVLFDPDNLSPFEKNVVKKFIPFYTFTKQNLTFQANNLIKNTSKYSKLYKAFSDVYDQVGEENYSQYQKEGFEVPFLTDEKGNTTFLKTNLPLSDLGEFAADPLRRILSSTSPLIKAPIEMVTGQDIFTGQDRTSNPLDYIMSTSGLGNASKLVKNAQTFLSDDATTQEKLARLLPSVMRYADSDKIANSKMYQELQEYQELVKNLKKQGIDIPTVKELTNSSQSKLRKLQSTRQKRNSYR